MLLGCLERYSFMIVLPAISDIWAQMSQNEEEIQEQLTSGNKCFCVQLIVQVHSIRWVWKICCNKIKRISHVVRPMTASESPSFLFLQDSGQNPKNLLHLH